MNNLRDHFAAMAMQSLIGRETQNTSVWNHDVYSEEDGFEHDVASRAYQYADAMVSHRSKRVIEDVEKEVERLRGLGWTQADFARALKNILEEEPSNGGSGENA